MSPDLDSPSILIKAASSTGRQQVRWLQTRASSFFLLPAEKDKPIPSFLLLYYTYKKTSRASSLVFLILKFFNLFILLS